MISMGLVVIAGQEKNIKLFIPCLASLQTIKGLEEFTTLGWPRMKAKRKNHVDLFY